MISTTNLKRVQLASRHGCGCPEREKTSAQAENIRIASDVCRSSCCGDAYGGKNLGKGGNPKGTTDTPQKRFTLMPSLSRRNVTDHPKQKRLGLMSSLSRRNVHSKETATTTTTTTTKLSRHLSSPQSESNKNPRTNSDSWSFHSLPARLDGLRRRRSVRSRRNVFVKRDGDDDEVASDGAARNATSGACETSVNKEQGSESSKLTAENSEEEISVVSEKETKKTLTTTTTTTPAAKKDAQRRSTMAHPTTEGRPSLGKYLKRTASRRSTVPMVSESVDGQQGNFLYGGGALTSVLDNYDAIVADIDGIDESEAIGDGW